MKIAIVDDSPQIRTNLLKFISLIKGSEVVIEAVDARSAIELIKGKKPDIVILDIELKNSSGFEVLNAIKGESKTAPIVMMFTNLSTFSYKEKALKEGADYFFDKTNDLDNLLHVIKSLA